MKRAFAGAVPSLATLRSIIAIASSAVVEMSAVTRRNRPLPRIGSTGATPLVYWFLHAEQTQSYSMVLISLVLGAGKIVAFALCATSTLAVLRRSEASGVLGALKLGARSVAANAGWFLPVFAGLWLFQEGCVYLAKQLAPGLLFAGFFTTALPLLGCVALPVEAWRSGTLSKS